MTPELSYRMVSVPAILDKKTIADVLQDDLGAYDDTLWRLLRFNGNKYEEYGVTGFADFYPALRLLAYHQEFAKN